MIDRHRNRLLCGIVVAVILLSGDTKGQESGTKSTLGEPVDSGYVILNGRYLSPPYVPERRGDDLWINGQLADSGFFSRPMRGMRHGRGERESDRHWRGPWRVPMGRQIEGPSDAMGLLHVESKLQDNYLLIGGNDIRCTFLSVSDAATAVDILLSEKSADRKLWEIQYDLSDRLDEASWRQLIATFVPSDELAQRLGSEIERVRRVVAENQVLHEAALASAFWNSQPVKYMITLAAMGLVVAACGTLLNYRPQSHGRWSEIDASGEGIPIVVRGVVLLLLLGVFDLGCTLVAQQAGGFTELNPLGGRIVENPLLLSSFKLASLLMACAILYALRRYRGAQVAAWWMCLLCTVLAFRWVTYNSMFVT